MPRTAAATAGHMRAAAIRAVDDPAQLAKAARIVRAALARQVLTEDDLRGEIVQSADLRTRELDSGADQVAVGGA